MDAQGELDLDFRRYRETREPAALARVFDAAAPELLRVAVHLVGRAGEAEDLVQATFVAAIEQAGAFDPRREALPWLLGILANKARMAKRSAAREPDPARLAARAEAGPLEEALGAELSGELAKAIDRMDEPYRRVLILRLRHGLAPADIAHALGESPGAVRVRIHRGLEELRRCLPAGLGAALLALVEPARGLSAVREAVIAHAHTAAAVTGSTSIAIGGTLMSKKALVLAVVALAAISIPLWNHFGARPDRTAPPVEPELASAALARADPEVSEAPDAGGGDPAVAAIERADVGAAPAAPAEMLRGRVIDGETKAPIAGVLVELYQPVRMPLRAARERGYDVLAKHALPVATIVRTAASRPHDVVTWDLLGVLEDDDIFVAGLIEPATTALAHARTDADGRFAIPFPAGGGTLACSSEAYGCVSLALRKPPEGVTITLHRARRFAGRVVDQDDHPVRRAVDLAIRAMVAMHDGPLLDNQGREVFSETWLLQTDADGCFEIALPAKQVSVSVLSPGLIRVGPSTFDTGAEEPALVKTTAAPFLRIRDARNGTPIEHVSIVSKNAASTSWWSGEYFARDGLFALLNNAEFLRQAAGPHEFTVWAEGYACTTQRVADFSTSGEILVELQPGSLPVLSGRVSLGGKPIEGARAWLKPCRATHWRIDDPLRGDGDRTDVDGRFRLSMPPGSYVLEIDTENGTFAEIVPLERDTERSIELARLGRIVAEVRDVDGVPRSAHTIALRGPDGRQQLLETDEVGRVEFCWLPDGHYELHAPLVSTMGSFGGGVVEHADIAGGSTALVTMVVPSATGPIHARVTADGVDDYSRWSARYVWGQWMGLEPDGTIPIDLATTNTRNFEITSPDRLTWNASLPSELKDGYLIRVRLDGPCYEGVVLDRETGEPVPALKVHADAGEVSERAHASPMAMTDARGRFRLVCASESPHALWFESGRMTAVAGLGTDVYGSAQVKLSMAPSKSPDPITIRIPRLDSGRLLGLPVKTIRGHVLDRSTHSGVPQASIQVAAIEELPCGTMELSIQCLALDDGSYELVVPDALSYQASVASSRNERRTRLTWDGLLGRDETRDFELP